MRFAWCWIANWEPDLLTEITVLKYLKVRGHLKCWSSHFLGEEIQVQRDEIYGSASLAGQVGSKDYELEALSL